jgi:hypothetical protein
VGADKHRLAVALSGGYVPVVVDREIVGAERLFLKDIMGNLSPDGGNRARLEDKYASRGPGLDREDGSWDSAEGSGGSAVRLPERVDFGDT